MKLSTNYCAPGIEIQTMHMHNGGFDMGFTEFFPLSDLILCTCIKKETVGSEPQIHRKVIMATAFCHRLEKRNGSERLLPPPIIH